MKYQTQAKLHHGFLNAGGAGVVIGFLVMFFGMMSLGYWLVVAGSMSLLGGVATTFARDEHGRNVWLTISCEKKLIINLF